GRALCRGVLLPPSGLPRQCADLHAGRAADRAVGRIDRNIPAALPPVGAGQKYLGGVAGAVGAARRLLPVKAVGIAVPAGDAGLLVDRAEAAAALADYLRATGRR